MTGSREEYEEVIDASIEDFKACRFVDFDAYEMITWPDDSSYWDLEGQIELRKLWKPVFLASLIVAIASFLATIAIPPVATFSVLSLSFSLGLFPVAAFHMFRTTGKIERLRRDIRTWEWQNGQAS